MAVQRANPGEDAPRATLNGSFPFAGRKVPAEDMKFGPAQVSVSFLPSVSLGMVPADLGFVCRTWGPGES